MKKKSKDQYHHGQLAEALLDAVESLATRFGLEAVTLRGCAKEVGVSPSSAFRHYADKRALMTAFATRALSQLTDAMQQARRQALGQQENALDAVAIAYLTFAIKRSAMFRVMWRDELIYTSNDAYQAAETALIVQIQGGFANTLKDPDPHSLSDEELLVWSSVHGLASLFVDGSLAENESLENKLAQARRMLAVLAKAL